MNDYSFIRLEPNFLKAKSESLPSLAKIGYFDQIQLHPTETYLQITNTKEGIAFDGNYSVFVVDCIGTELLDITSKVAISEFTDSNGLPQIAFEIANINQDFYYRSVFLKFVHTVSDYVWYSNQILISSYKIEETSRFDYRDFTTFYLSADYFQSIRLRCNFELNDSESTSSQYTSINGTKVTSRLIETEFEKYRFQKIDNFTYRRLNKLLSQSVIYVNGNRVTDKQTISSTERKGDTNVFDIDFKVAINYADTFTSELQIFEPLTLVDFAPDGFYTLASFPLTIDGQFNRDVTLINGGYVTIINIDTDTVIGTFDTTEITVTGNSFSIDTSFLFWANGNYKITLSDNLFLSEFNEIFNAFEWDFSIATSDYAVADYSTDYFS